MKRNLDIQKEWESIGADFSAGIGLPLFSVPDNYFEHLASEIQDGITAISAPESALPHIPMAFEVPENYFESFSTKMFSLIPSIEDPLANSDLKSISKTLPFEVPETYFDTLTANIIAKIESEEDTQLELADSPLLTSLKGLNPFEVLPPVAITIPTAVNAPKETPKAKTIALKPKRKVLWSTWTAAASVAIFFLMGAAFLHLDHKTDTIQTAYYKNTEHTSKRLAAVSDEAIEAYLAAHIDEFDEELVAKHLSASDEGHGVENALNNISSEALESYMYEGLY